MSTMTSKPPRRPRAPAAEVLSESPFAASIRILRLLARPANGVALVGDQLFTDVSTEFPERDQRPSALIEQPSIRAVPPVNHNPENKIRIVGAPTNNACATVW
jgi:hypothetical protein